MALYKYNTLIMEMNASMRLDRHPELNSRWLEFVREANYRRQPNSSHQDTADGGFLEKAEVADLAQWVRQQHIDLVPELPSFTHSYYLLSAHPDLAEVPGEKWPDTYCPSNPKSYQLLFDVYDEYIEVLHPKMIHAGHDELFAPVGLCPLCKDKDIGERFGEDVQARVVPFEQRT
jgi:Glycosyl hydrolase family 20, catalytic domain